MPVRRRKIRAQITLLDAAGRCRESMWEIKRDIRAVLSWQRELGGSFVPLGESHSSPVEGAKDSPRADSPEPPSVVDLFGQPTRAPQPPPSSPYERIESLIPAGSPLLSMTSLEEVASFVRDARLVEIDHTRLNPVPGVGNPNADLMVVGEAPGADEDRQGEPFVGKAGMLLNKILEAIGFARGDVFIANILKSRPPNNRDPQADEVAAHIPILYKQIALIQPKLLLCVGRISGNALLGRTQSLASLRGKFHDFHGLPVLVTYHPAALLRNPQWKRPTWEDVQLLRQRYDELTTS